MQEEAPGLWGTPWGDVKVLTIPAFVLGRDPPSRASGVLSLQPQTLSSAAGRGPR